MAEQNFGDIPIEELADMEQIMLLHDTGESTVENEYQFRLINFRQNVSDLLAKHYALRSDTSWLLFQDLENGDELPGRVDARRDACIVLSNNQSNDRSLIRVIAADTYKMPNGSITYATTDVTVDSLDRAQCHVGPFSSSPDVVKEGSARYSPGFYIDEGELKIVGISVRKITASILSITAENGTVIYPFGNFNYVLDRLHALQVASKILDSMVMGLPPAYTS